MNVPKECRRQDLNLHCQLRRPWLVCQDVESFWRVNVTLQVVNNNDLRHTDAGIVAPGQGAARLSVRRSVRKRGTAAVHNLGDQTEKQG